MVDQAVVTGFRRPEPAVAVLAGQNLLDLLKQFVDDPIGGGEARLRAAVILLERHRSLAGLETVALAKEIELSLRADSAKRLGQRDAPRGARAYIKIAEDCPPDETCLACLCAAFKLHRQLTVKALAGVAENEKAPDGIRVQAVEIARPALPLERRLSLYETIARTATRDETAISLAEEVVGLNPGRGERLMAVVARRPMPLETRILLARKAREHGEEVLVEFGGGSRPPAERFAAALALADIRSRASAGIIADLARNRQNGLFRVEAAVLLPQWDILRCLKRIVCDRYEEEAVRRAACDAILVHHDDEGRSSLAELAEYSRVPKRTRDYIHQLLWR